MIKKILILLLALLIITPVALLITNNGFIITSFMRTYMQGKTTANINDHALFEVATIASNKVQPWPEHPKFNQQSLSAEFVSHLKKYRTSAFLIVKDGQLIFEDYYSGYHNRSKTNSFSMAKTINTLLVGIAIEEGYIQSLDQAITDFIPEFSSDPKGKNATLAHFSLMNSGYEWTEHYYSPFSPTVELYYSNDVESFLMDGSFSAEPGEFWEYSSASTQILGIALLRALQQAGEANSVSEYLSQKLWQPMGMNDDALWHTDGEGLDLVYCCVNTNARNFAKLGQLMLNGGKWGEQQLVPQAFVEKMIQPDGQAYYGYSTWLNYDSTPQHYSFRGHLGQYIIVVPEENMVIVRLAEKLDSDEDTRAKHIQGYIDEAKRFVTSSLKDAL